MKECDWLSEDDRIEGFEWRGGSDRVTSGVHIWSKPFVRENNFGEKVNFLSLSHYVSCLIHNVIKNLILPYEFMFIFIN